MELIALANFSPDGSRKLKTGEHFEMSASSARLLIALKKAKAANAQNEDPKRKYKTRAMQAEG